MKSMIGIFWGAFDPPTKAHLKIITEALSKLSLEKLVIIVNNHSYKTYTNDLESRVQLIKKALNQDTLDQVEILFQDDQTKLDYPNLAKKYEAPLCAIAGSDAYLSWLKFSSEKERELYGRIAVIPRGDIELKLEDSNATFLPIDEDCRHISSTEVRNQG